jgi:anti-anti-sigma factor
VRSPSRLFTFFPARTILRKKSSVKIEMGCLSYIEGECPVGTHAITNTRVSGLLLTMKNNLFPQRRRSAGAAILDGIKLRNPFVARDDQISDREPAPAHEAGRDGWGSSQHVLKIAGYKEMTAANCNRFRKTACAAWNGHTDIEIDVSETAFIDCAGLGALIAVRNLSQERKGVTRLVNPNSSVQQMLDLTRTGQLFDIINTADGETIFGPAAHN